MTRNKYFIIGVVSMTFLLLVDLFITWKTIPDLKLEANPIVSEWGFGWTGLLIFGFFWQLLLIIPFYYHCLVFNYPKYTYKKKFSSKFIWEIYFFRNHVNPYLSVGKGIFNILGYFIFWDNIIGKVLAICNNLLLFIGDSFGLTSGHGEVNTKVRERFSGTWVYDLAYYYSNIDQTAFINRTTIICVFIALWLFGRNMMSKARNNYKRETNTNSIHIFLIIFFLILYSLIWIDGKFKIFSG